MEGKKVLVVEDNSEIAEIVAILLEKEGHSITEIVDSGEDALVSAAADTPDIVITDINLEGDIDGIETATYMSHLFRIPVVFMTGVVDQNIIEKAKAAEPYGYLSKPFKNNELLATVSLAVRTFELNLKAQEGCAGKTPSCVRHMYSHNEGIVITNSSGRILYINRYIENLTGHKNSAMIFRPLSDILNFSGNADFSSRALGKPGNYGEDETVFLTDRSGGRIMIRIRVVPRKYRDEDTIGAVITLKEIPDGKTEGTKDTGIVYKPGLSGVAA